MELSPHRENYLIIPLFHKHKIVNNLYNMLVKTSKNLGISKMCPWCGKTFIRDVNFKGEGDAKQKCVHCKNPVKITFKNKPHIDLTRILILTLLFAAILIIGITMKARPEYVDLPLEYSH